MSTSRCSDGATGTDGTSDRVSHSPLVHKNVIYPDNFESKIGFDRIKSQIKALCVTQGAADKLSEAEFSNDYDRVVSRLES